MSQMRNGLRHLSELVSVGTAARLPVPDLLERGVILREEWDELPADTQAELLALADEERALAALVGRHLITRFQADVIREGNAASLILGHYRLLEPLGRGGMGVVYRAEHRHLRRAVALKVMTERHTGNARLAGRFFLEARAVARLQHPNIVGCLDAGRDGPHRPGGPVREYYVMDLVPGADLQATVAAGGRCRSTAPPRCSARWRRPWPRRTGTGWCTATSSRRTFSSPRTGRRRSWTSGWPGTRPGS
ncbi:hypothetical protein FTUN_5596 [Frigoriglobus tundricola]|uniref:Protein kinase domain-containing protein n=1 Tax=Frigoriglobus tundricola TaxID=2774151 RepID=A0A6M5YX99_9BACT|nr:hypothetical protein FTUN_5596 [Frigoriglobus tundricola]